MNDLVDAAMLARLGFLDNLKATPPQSRKLCAELGPLLHEEHLWQPSLRLESWRLLHGTPADRPSTHSGHDRRNMPQSRWSAPSPTIRLTSNTQAHRLRGYADLISTVPAKGEDTHRT